MLGDKPGDVGRARMRHLFGLYHKSNMNHQIVLNRGETSSDFLLRNIALTTGWRIGWRGARENVDPP